MSKTVFACLGVLVWVGAVSLRAQTPQTQTAPPPVPTLDVSSVKPSNPNGGGPFGSMPMVLPQGTGRLSASNITLRLLIRMSYGMQDFQIVGGPDWQTTNKFDITAKAVDGTTSSTQDLQPLMRSILADRFKLKTHTEKRELPVYHLVLARTDKKLGPDMKPSTSDCSNAAADAQKRAEALLKGGPTALAAMLPKPGETIKCAVSPAINPANPAAGFGMHGDGQPMTMLTQLLTQFSGRPVEDKTGLTGLYDWDVRFDPEVLLRLAQSAGINLPPAATGALTGANSPFADSPSLMTALQEQLGLKLESARGPVDVLVIESAELPQPD
jgi:uncharacterized protein (TIGR03435 family)